MKVFEPAAEPTAASRMMDATPTASVNVAVEQKTPLANAARKSGILDAKDAPDISMVLREDGTPYMVGQDKTLYSDPIAVGYVHGGMVYEVFCRSLYSMLRADRNIKITLHESSCNLPLNRNIVLQRFLEAPASQGEWLLFLDTDLGFHPYTAALLLKVAKETGADIAGVPYLLTNQCSTTAKAIPGGGYHTQGAWVFDRAYLADALGTGCMLIKRSLLEKMKVAYADKEPWPFCGYDQITINGRPEYESEDYSFCRRAREIGAKLVSYTGLVLSHHKVSPLIFQGLESEAYR